MRFRVRLIFTKYPKKCTKWKKKIYFFFGRCCRVHCFEIFWIQRILEKPCFSLRQIFLCIIFVLLRELPFLPFPLARKSHPRGHSPSCGPPRGTSPPRGSDLLQSSCSHNENCLFHLLGRRILYTETENSDRTKLFRLPGFIIFPQSCYKK